MPSDKIVHVPTKEKPLRVSWEGDDTPFPEHTPRPRPRPAPRAERTPTAEAGEEASSLGSRIYRKHKGSLKVLGGTAGLVGGALLYDAYQEKKRKKAQENPTMEEKTAANPLVTFAGIKVRIDRPVGYVQKGKDKEGKPWQRVYKRPYGYLPGTQGGDGDGLDVFLGTDERAKEGYLCHQKKDDGSFDEYKLMLGFPTKEAAKACYVEHIPAKFLGKIEPISLNVVRALTGRPLDAEAIIKQAFEEKVAASAIDEASDAAPDSWVPGKWERDRTAKLQAQREEVKAQLAQLLAAHPDAPPEALQQLHAQVDKADSYQLDRVRDDAAAWLAPKNRVGDTQEGSYLHSLDAANKRIEKLVAEHKLSPEKAEALRRLSLPQLGEVEDNHLRELRNARSVAVTNPRSVAALQHLTDDELKSFAGGLDLNPAEKALRERIHALPDGIGAPGKGGYKLMEELTPKGRSGSVFSDAVLGARAEHLQAAEEMAGSGKPLFDTVSERLDIQKPLNREQVEASAADYRSRGQREALGNAGRAYANANLPNFIKDRLGNPEELAKTYGMDEAKGFDRVKQIFHGSRLRQMQEALNSMDLKDPRRVPLLQQLGGESERVFKGQNVAMAASMALPYAAKYAPVAIAGAVGGKALAKKKMMESLEGYNLTKEERALPEEQRHALLMERSRTARGLFGESEETPDVTAGDVQKGLLGAGAIAKGLQSTSHATAEQLLGARRFWHGTTTDSAQRILGTDGHPATGIDPGLGGRMGGAAWRNTQKQHLADTLHALSVSPLPDGPELQETLHLLRNKAVESGINPDLIPNSRWGLQDAAKAVQPGVVVPGIRALDATRAGGGLFQNTASLLGSAMRGAEKPDLPPDMVNFMETIERAAKNRPDIDVDASGFVERAKGTPFIATAPEAAQQYALMQNPEMAAGRMERAKAHLEKLEPIKAFNALMTGLPQEGASPVIGGVMPDDTFRKGWVRDPDDTEQAGKAYKLNETERKKVPLYPPGFFPTEVSEHAIHPSQLASNDVSLGQIVKNRARDMGAYIRGTDLEPDERALGLNKRFLGGLGRAGLTAAGVAGTYKATLHPLVKKIVNKVKERKQEHDEAAGKLAPLAAPVE